MNPVEVCEQDQSEHFTQNCSQKGSQESECNLTGENREPEDEGSSRLGLGQPGAAVGVVQLTWTSQQARPGCRSPHWLWGVAFQGTWRARVRVKGRARIIGEFKEE